MSMNQMGAGFQLMARDAATPIFGKVKAGFGSMTKSIRGNAVGIGQSLGTLAVGFAALKIGSGMTGMAKTFADAAGKFEKGLISVSLKARATESETMALHDKAIRSAMDSQFSPDETIDALENLATKGFNAADQMAILDDVLNMATAGSMNMNDAADAVSGTMRSMGYEVNNAGMVTDKLLKITQMTNFQTADFAIGLSRATSTAKLYKQSLSDTLINMGLLRNMNIEASVASTSLRESWRRMATDQRAQQSIQKLGIDIFDKQTKQIRPMLDVMADVAEATKKLDDKEKMRLVTTAFGVRGMASFNAVAEASYKIMDGTVPIILKGQKAINAMRLELAHSNDEMTEAEKKALAMSLGVDNLDDSLKDATGTAQFFKEQMLDTYEGQKTLIEGARQALAVVVGEAGTKLFKPVARLIYMLTAGMANFFASIPMEARQVLLGVVTALGTLLAGTGGIMLLSGALSMLGISIGGLIFSFVKLALVMAPIMVLLGGLALGAYAAYRSFSQNAGGIGDSWKEMLRKVKLAWTGLVELVASGELSEATGKELEKTENAGVLKFLQGAERAMERLGRFWDGLVKGFKEGVDRLSGSPAMARLKATLDGVFSLFTGQAGKDTEAALQSWGKAGETTGEKLASFGEMAIDALNKVIDVVKRVTGAIGELTTEDINAGINTLTGTFEVLWTILNKVETAISIIYYTLKGLISLFVEFFRNIASGVGRLFGPLVQGVGELFSLISPKKLREQEGFAGDVAKKWFAAGQNVAGAGEWMRSGSLDFESTLGSFSNLGDAVTAEADRMAEAESSRNQRQYRAESRTSQQGKMAPLVNQRQNILEWMSLSTADWRKTEGGGKGAYSFQEATPQQQQQFMGLLKELNKSIKSLGGQVVVELDGEKLARGLRKTGAGSGEDSLEEAAVAEPGF